MNPAPPKVNLVEVLAWALLAFVGAMAMLVFRPLPLFDDSYQYLNVAGHIQHDRHIATSLVHFDTERSHGVIPAPLTTFPPGYPLAIAFTSVAGDFEAAARFLSCLCYACTAGLLSLVLLLTGVTAFVRHIILLLYATNAVALAYSTSVLSEPLYVLLSTAAVVALIWSEEPSATKISAILRVVFAMSAAALAYLVRYAGLFLIAAFLGYALLRLLLPATRFRGAFLLVSLIPIATAGAVMLRNLAVAGTWKGGNELTVRNSVKHMLADYAKAQWHLITGTHAVMFGVWEILLLAGTLILAVIFISSPRSRDAIAEKSTPALLITGLCVLIYSAGIFYAGLHTVISFGTRMFLPMLPLYLLLAGLALQWITSRTQKTCLALIAIALIGINARDLYLHPQPAPHEILKAEFAEPSADGRPLSEWVAAHIPAGQVILAADGQATGFLLHRPTVSMIGSHYSAARWECDEVRNQMQRFHANFVFLDKPPSPGSPSLMGDPDPLLTESRFVAASASNPPACGFTIAAENADLRILTTAARN